MVTKSQPNDSHPICPTCEGDLTGKELLHYLASARSSPRRGDDISNFYEETSRLVRFLGALAQAGSLAAGQAEDGPPHWIENFVWLAEELTEETERRL